MCIRLRERQQHVVRNDAELSMARLEQWRRLTYAFAYLLRLRLPWWPRLDHMWRCLGFRHRTSQLARKLLNFLPQPLHAMTRHLDKFRDFRTSFAFYIIKKHFFNKLVVMFRETDVRNFTNVPAHGLKIHSKTWIPFFESLNSNISCTCSSNLLFREKFK